MSIKYGLPISLEDYENRLQEGRAYTEDEKPAMHACAAFLRGRREGESLLEALNANTHEPADQKVELALSGTAYSLENVTRRSSWMPAKWVWHGFSIALVEGDAESKRHEYLLNEVKKRIRKRRWGF